MRASASRSRIGRSGVVKPLAGRSDQPLYVLDRQHLRQRPSAARPLDRERRIVPSPPLGIEMLVELPDGGEPARKRRGLETFRAARGEIGAHVRRAGGQRALATLAKMRRIVGEVAPIGFDRVEARSAFRRERLEEADDERTCRMSHGLTFGNWHRPP